MSNVAFVIREIGDGDVEPVIAMWQAASLIQPWNDPHADIQAARKDPHAAVLIAAQGNGAVLGETRVCATVMVSENGRAGEVCYVAVAAPWRGTGLGRHIVAAAEAWLIARHIGRLELRVHEDNRHAQGFYAHLGFRQTGLVYYRKELVVAV